MQAQRFQNRNPVHDVFGKLEDTVKRMRGMEKEKLDLVLSEESLSNEILSDNRLLKLKELAELEHSMRKERVLGEEVEQGLDRKAQSGEDNMDPDSEDIFYQSSEGEGIIPDAEKLDKSTPEKSSSSGSTILKQKQMMFADADELEDAEDEESMSEEVPAENIPPQIQKQFQKTNDRNSVDLSQSWASVAHQYVDKGSARRTKNIPSNSMLSSDKTGGRDYRFVCPLYRRRRLKWLQRKVCGRHKEKELKYAPYYVDHPDQKEVFPDNKGSVTIKWPNRNF